MLYFIISTAVYLSVGLHFRKDGLGMNLNVGLCLVHSKSIKEYHNVTYGFVVCILIGRMKKKIHVKCIQSKIW